MRLRLEDLILNSYQIQPARGRSRPCSGSVTRFQNPRYVLRRQSSLPHKDESSDQIPHHVVKKSRSLHRVYQFISLPLPHRRKNAPDVRYRLAFAPTLGVDRSERRKIVLTLKNPLSLCDLTLDQKKQIMQNMTG